jgi:low affinity Fe/Cu permease
LPEPRILRWNACVSPEPPARAARLRRVILRCETVAREVHTRAAGVGMELTQAYSQFAKAASRFSGRPSVFTMAVVTIVVWIVTGPIFDFSDTWQLVINTATTIVTFLMVFLIQSSQNRDTEAIQVKLDELIRATQGAHNELLDLEEMTEEELDRFRLRYEKLATLARAKLERGDFDTDTPDLQESSQEKP